MNCTQNKAIAVAAILQRPVVQIIWVSSTSLGAAIRIHGKIMIVRGDFIFPEWQQLHWMIPHDVQTST